MSQDVTKEMIDALIKQAAERDIFGKAMLVAREMGKSQSVRHGVHYTFTDDKLYIWYDDYGPNMTINWDGERVYSNQLGNKVWAYRPSAGPWEDLLVKHYLTAKEIADLKKDMRSKKEQEELNRSWG